MSFSLAIGRHLAGAILNLSEVEADTAEHAAPGIKIIRGNAIYRYAQLDRVQSVIRPYLEAMT
ncbi:hypothetical protein [Sphingomonas hengshuiensis]|uniref:Uncharacterized protein n=1 Tax=Sphingomonas hengshuiensis TaxID=1609977 RepID=A0A7U5BEM7_9SPHN|nr:hypothetical protein [Sphingomonas hengshuiensis]AJP70770.1 hypothetical protein TS85_01425 [Sphingomonas hengshuiensis]